MLSSNVQTSVQLAPCMAMHGFTLPRALQEASRRSQEWSKRTQDSSSSALEEASRRPQECSKMLQTWEVPEEHLRALSKMLKKSQHQAHLDLGLNVTQSGPSDTHSKNLFDSTQLDSASFGSTSSVHGYACVHTSTCMYSYVYAHRARLLDVGS